MRKYLIIIQIIIGLVIGLLNFPFKFYKKIDFINGHTNQLAYYPLDTAIFYINTNDSSDNYNFHIYDTNNNLIDSVLSSCKPQLTNIDSASKYGLNYRHESKFVIANHFNPGIYYFENKIPFIINNYTENYDLAVVIPYLNYLLNVHHIEKYKKVSIENLYDFDPYSKVLLPFLQDLENKLKIKYVTDLELESYNSISNVNTILFYGDVKHFSEKSRANFDRFNKNGGNIILMSSLFMNNIITVNGNTVELDSLTWQNHKKPEYLSTGANYYNSSPCIPLYETKELFDEYRFINKNNPMLENINEDLSKGYLFDGHNFNCIRSEIIYNNKPYIDFYFPDFYKGEIIAYNVIKYKNRVRIGAISILQKNNKYGYILNYGTEGFVSADHLQSEIIQKLIINGIELMTSGKNPFTEQVQIRD